MSPTDETTVSQVLAPLAAAGDVAYRWHLSSDGGRFHWVQDRGRGERDTAGRTLRIVGVMRIITARKASELRLEKLVHFDELTGLFNKLRLREAIHQTLDGDAAAERQSAYLAVGIDNMTMINDAFGYEAADAVIVAVGRRIERCLAHCDIIGRVGGDRFGVFLGTCAQARIGTA